MFTKNGRINRTTFLLGNLLLTILALPIISFSDSDYINKLDNVSTMKDYLLLISISILLFGFIALSFNLLIRRLHDIGLSAWFLIVTFLPGVQIVLMLIPGNKIKNVYGKPPVKKLDYGSLFSS